MPDAKGRYSTRSGNLEQVFRARPVGERDRHQAGERNNLQKRLSHIPSRKAAVALVDNLSRFLGNSQFRVGISRDG